MTSPHNSSPTVSLQEHPEFLAMLQNEGFRQELQANPMEVLERFGVRLAEPPASTRLPSIPQSDTRAVRWVGLV